LPVNTVGTAEGRITFRNSRGLDRPSERAALTSSGSTVLTPAIVLSSTGHTHAYRTKVTFDSSPMPSSSVNTGSSASAAVLRASSSSGCRNRATGRYQPISRPSGTATATAIANPAADRPTQANKNTTNRPARASSQSARRSSDSGG